MRKNTKKCQNCYTTMTPEEVQGGVCYGCGRVTEGVKCKHCVRWAKTKRPCTINAYGECDCPKCFGICECDGD